MRTGPLFRSGSALPSYLILITLLAIIIGVPVISRLTAARPQLPRTADSSDTPVLQIVTPHVEQIRFEFGRAFDAWHLEKYKQPVRIDWRTLGGTTEIRKQLEAQMTAAVAAGAFTIAPPRTLLAPGRAEASKPNLPEVIIDPKKADVPDLFFGGGSFEHSAIKSGLVLKTTIDGKEQEVRVRLTAPPKAPWSADDLKAIYGENKVGVERLFDPDQHWFGVALSGFGIIFNRDLLQEMNISEPTQFADLGNPKLVGRVGLADPRQSGSVATLYDSILNKEGWDRGWRILREMAANARYFSASSIQPPMDVAQGECVMGVAIDFYGRGQSQAVVERGGDVSTSRLVYIDPPGATYVDADPISIINGAKNAELAQRFVEFCMTKEAQALWQFAPRGEQSGTTPGLGPIENRLRRMPARRVMYEQYLDQFTDRTNPFDIAIDAKSRGWRDLLGPLFGAFAVDTRDEMVEAWKLLNKARQTESFPKDTLQQMEIAFYAMPKHTMFSDGKLGTGDSTKPIKAGEQVDLSEATYALISTDTGRFRDPEKGTRARIAYTKFFRQQYQMIIDLAEQNGL
jgi:iron(III) transport system substrate-binding protein